MRNPLPPGSAINGTRMVGWLTAFGGYREPLSEGAIDRWINQFDSKDRDIAARLIDSVDFINTLQIRSAFRNILSSIEGWSIDEVQRRGNWRFVPFSGTSGSSADSMIHIFRQANGLTRNKFNSLFVYRSDLLRDTYTENDTILFIDDFSATGNQACESWKEFFYEIVPPEPRKILILVASSDAALERIRTETDLEVINDIILTDSDNIFHDRCRHFSTRDKNTLLKYCHKADKRHPRGYGDSGYVVVFSHRCPNNTIPVLHVTQKQWRGLFPRHD
ncbi:MAG: hypothetical protein KKC25_10865 [Proteobacteria bacterium]|nr:hypothetical protein [Pseudomonadota bacterium]